MGEAWEQGLGRGSPLSRYIQCSVWELRETGLWILHRRFVYTHAWKCSTGFVPAFWSVLRDSQLPALRVVRNQGQVMIEDPCPIRVNFHIQDRSSPIQGQSTDPCFGGYPTLRSTVYSDISGNDKTWDSKMSTALCILVKSAGFKVERQIAI